MTLRPLQAYKRTAPARPAGSYKWWVVFMLWFICFFNYADRQAIYSVFPRLEEEFGFSKVQLGLIGSAFSWVYAAGAPLAGFIGDQVSRKALILGGCLFWSFVTVTTGWCQRLWHFVTVRALEGFGETFYFPASMSLVSDYHGGRTRSRALSLHQSSVYIGTIAGSWLGAWFAEQYGWRVGFYFFGGSGMVLALFLYRWLREPVRGQADRHVDASLRDAEPGLGETGPRVGEVCRAVFRAPTAILLLIVFLGANFVAMMFLAWMPTFLFEKFHFTLTTAGLWGTLFIHLASAFGAPAGGVLADRFARSIPGGRILVQALGLSLGAGLVFLVGTTRNVSTLLAAMTLFGLCKGLYDSNIFASLYDVIEPRARATAAGVMNTVGWAGGALGPLWVGTMAEYGPRPTAVDNMSLAIAWGGAVYLAGAAVLAAAIFGFARRDYNREKESHPTRN